MKPQKPEFYTFLIKKIATITCCLAASFSVEFKNKKCNAKKVIFWGC
jgi:hypothetical protein